MNPIINAHVEQKTRLLEENKGMVEEKQRLLEENKGLLEEDKKNKQMLANWKIQREALTHIMAGTMPVDHAELSKARKSVSAFMNPASLQTEINKLNSDVQPEQEVPRTIRAGGFLQLEQEVPRKLLPPMKRSWPEVSDEAMNEVMKASNKK